MPSVLDVRSLLRQHRQSKAADIHDLARRLAADQIVAPEDILETLIGTGTQEDEFLDLVDLCRRRAELRKTAAGLDALNQELVGIRAVMKKHRATLDEAEVKYRAAIDPLARQEEDTQSRFNLAQAARSSLSSASNTPKFLRDAVESARSTLLKALTAVAEKTRTIESEQKRSDEAREELDQHWRGADKALDAWNKYNGATQQGPGNFFFDLYKKAHENFDSKVLMPGLTRMANVEMNPANGRARVEP